MALDTARRCSAAWIGLFANQTAGIRTYRSLLISKTSCLDGADRLRAISIEIGTPHPPKKGVGLGYETIDIN